MARFRKRSAGNSYQRLGKMACGVCNSSIMGSSLYVVVIGLIGTAVTAFDVMRIVNCNKAVDECPENSATAAAASSRSTRVRAVVPADVERDLKLMTSILGIEHYTLIMLGALTDYPMLHAPWLLMQLCIIAIELMVFLVRIFLEGLHVSRDEILLSILNLHNWMQVFCLFQRQAARHFD